MPNDFNPTAGKSRLPIGRILSPGGSQQIRDINSNYWFGPLQPVRPTAPADYRPRQFGYLPGANIIWQPKGEDSAVGFPTLRALADSWDLLRLVIETRKKQISRVPWEIRVKAKPGEKVGDQKKRAGADKTLQQLNAFFRKPDGFHSFAQWIKMLAEDMLVIDAMTVYFQRDTDGKIAQLVPLAGDTINRMMTDQGVTPPPPSVAYQQVVYGTPACGFTTDDLLYYMANERTWKRYGYSPVEQILITISIGLRRQEFQLQYYTSGNIPEAMCFLPSDLPIDRVKEIQDWFDSVLAGDLGKRRRLTFLPGYGTGDNAKPNVIFPKEPLLKDEMDGWLAQVVCYAFGVSHQGLMKMMNRASAEESNDASESEGLEPDLIVIADLCNQCIDAMGLADEYEFAWQAKKEVDVLKQAQVDNILAGKIMKVDEIREARGLDPDGSPEANMLGMFSPQNGFIPLSGPGAIRNPALPAPAPEIGPDGEEKPGSGKGPQDDPSGGKKPPAVPGSNTKGKPDGKEKVAAKAADSGHGHLRQSY
jgi:hypothetical protein